MVDSSSLIRTARLLLGSGNKGAPNQARLRRAVSSAYYALFHAIARSAADTFIGAKHRAKPGYETVYRGFEHRLMRDSCASIDKPALGAKAKRAMGMDHASPELRDVASAFVTLQGRRHWADYSPNGKLTRSEAHDLIDLAALGISQLNAASADERRNFLAYLLAGVRG